MRFFITGIHGFVGGAIARALASDGDKVMGLSRKPQQHAESTNLEIAHGDLSDPNRLCEQMENCDVVIHAAGPRNDRTQASELKATLIEGTENLLNAALAAKVERLVLISCTDVTLHRGKRINWGENRTPAGEKVFGDFATLQRLAEELTLAFGARGLETTSLRPAFLWGPGMRDPRNRFEREHDRGWRMVGRGTNYYATTHLKSLVDAVRSAAEVSRAAGNRYYIADDGMATAGEFMSELSQALRLPAPEPGPLFWPSYARAWLEERQQGPGSWRADVIRRGCPTVFDTLAARRDLDWEPSVSIEQGLRGLRVQDSPLSLVTAPRS